MGTHPIFESDFDCLTEKGFQPMAEVHDMMDYLEQYAYLNHDDILLYLVQKQKEEMADEEDEEDQVQISEIQVHDDNAKQRKKWGYKTHSAIKIKLNPMYDEKKTEKFKIRITENVEFALTCRFKGKHIVIGHSFVNCYHHRVQLGLQLLGLDKNRAINFFFDSESDKILPHNYVQKDADFETNFVAHEKGTFRPGFGLTKGDSGGLKAVIHAELYVINCQKVAAMYMDNDMRELVRQYRALQVAIRSKLAGFESDDQVVPDSVVERADCDGKVATVSEEEEIVFEPEEQSPPKTQSLMPNRRRHRD